MYIKISKIQLDVIISVTFALISFIFSLLIIDFYTHGDQSHYIRYWLNVQELSFSEAYVLLGISLGSAEPVYAFLTYVFSGIIEKKIIMSILNASIVYLLVLWMLKKNVTIVIIPFLLLNFYLLVLFFAAERLKIGLLFFLIAEHYSKFKLVWYILSLLSHVSVLIILIVRYSNIFYKLFLELIHGYITKKTIFYIIIYIIISSAILYVLLEHIINKLEYAHLDSLSISGILKMSVFIGMGVFYSQKKIEPIIAGLPLILTAGILGPDRVVMFGYFLFMYYGLQYKRGLNFGIFITTVYFIIASITFMDAIVLYGDGFYFVEKVQAEMK